MRRRRRRIRVRVASSPLGSVHLGADGEVLWGAMSSDGNWGVLAGDVGGGGRPMFFFLVR